MSPEQNRRAPADPRTEVIHAERARFLAAAEEFAGIAREVIVRVRRDLRVEEKPDRSLVTQADIEIEERLRDEVAKRFPEHGVVGEEFGVSQPDAEFQWVFDPVDGTDEFVHGVPTFGTVIGLLFRGSPLLGLIDHQALDLRTSGGLGLGVRRNGVVLPPLAAGENILEGEERAIVSKPKNFLYLGDERPLFGQFASRFPRLRIFDSCYAYTQIMSGDSDLMFDFNTSIWDFSPCQVFLEELGGSFVSVRRRSEAEDGKWRYVSVFGKPAVVCRAIEFLPPADASPS